MRKCDACGYLSLGDGEACRHCGAALAAAAPEELVAAHAAAPAAESTAPAPPVPPAPPAPLAAEPIDYWVTTTMAPRAPAPPPPGAPASSPSPFGAPPGVPPAFPPVPGYAPPAPPWNPTAGTPAAPVGRSRPFARVVSALLAIAAVVLGGITIDHALGGSGLPEGTSAFVAGHGVAYESPDHTFHAQFPSAPQLDQRPITTSTARLTLNSAQVQTDSYEVGAASMVLPFTPPADQLDTLLHDILRDGVNAAGGNHVTTKPITIGGATGIEATATATDGYSVRVAVLGVGPRLYMLGVHSKRGTDRLYDALVASFVAE